MRTLPTTLAQRFAPKNNALNGLRLILALLVVVSHAWPLGGYGEGWTPGGQELGFWAVGGFFAISGFLITRSRFNPTSTSLTFVWHRVLRIYPGLWVCLLVTVLVLAPIAARREGSALGLDGMITYFLGNASAWSRVDGISTTLVDVPLAQAWSGPLWTLFYEIACYVGVAVFGGIALLRRRAWLMPVALVMAIALMFVRQAAVAADGQKMLVLGSFFAAGATLYLYGRYVPISNWAAGLAATALTLVGVAGVPVQLAALPVAYLCMWAGIVVPLRVGATNDLSYGVYIYGWPVAQVLAVYGLHDDGVWLFLALTILGTLPLALTSWRWVEKPALGLKDWSPGRGGRVSAVSRTSAPGQQPAEAE